MWPQQANSLVPSNFSVTVKIDMESGIKFGLVIFLFVMLAVALGSVIGAKLGK
jgi:hypothetical protein